MDGGEEAASRLRLVDRVAETVIRRARPVRFAVASSEEERLAAYRLRHRAVVTRGWASPEELGDGVECDEHDARAIQIVGWLDAEPVATTRVLLPDPARRLPTEIAFDLDLTSVGAVEFGRFVVERARAGEDHRTFAGLLGSAWLESRRHGYERMCGADTPAMIALLRRMGFAVTILAAPARHWGEDRAPILVDVAASSEALARRWGDGDGAGAEAAPQAAKAISADSQTSS